MRNRKKEQKLKEKTSVYGIKNVKYREN